MKLENIISKIGKCVASGMLIAMPFVSACQNSNVINPLAPEISNAVYQNSGTKFSGDTITAGITPTEKPYQKVEGRTQRPTEDWSNYQELTDSDNDGNYDLSLSSTPYPGDYNFQFRTQTGNRQTESDIVTVPVYMNEEQSDSALEQAIQEINVHPELVGTPAPVPTAETKGLIKAYEINSNYGTRNYDGIIYIHCGNGPFYTEMYFMNVKGFNSDGMSQADIDNVKPPYGVLEIGPVKIKDEIKDAILTEKNITTPHSWPQLANW